MSIQEINDKNIISGNNTYVITVCSGKGGVGKSIVSTNLAYSLSEMESNVLIFDGNLNYPNQHLICGIEPNFRLYDVIHSQLDYNEAIYKINNNLSMIAERPATGEMDNYSVENLRKLLEKIKFEKKFDYVVIDTLSGAYQELFEFCRISDLILIIINDEPTSLLDAYGLIKIFRNYVNIRKIALLVNNVIDNDDANDISNKLNLATEKFLKLKVDVVGYIPYDRAVRNSVLMQEPFVLSAPDSEASKALARLAKKIMKKNKNMVKV